MLFPNRKIYLPKWNNIMPNPLVDKLAKVSRKEGTWVEKINFDSRNRDETPFQAAIFSIAPGCESIPDKHQVKESWVIQSGSGLLTYDDQTFIVNKNDVLFFDSFKEHRILNNSDETMVIVSLWWQ